MEICVLLSALNIKLKGDILVAIIHRKFLSKILLSPVPYALSARCASFFRVLNNGVYGCVPMSCCPLFTTLVHEPNHNLKYRDMVTWNITHMFT